MSVRSSIDAIRRKLGLTDGRCPRCGQPPGAINVVVVGSCGHEPDGAAVEAALAPAPRCPACGQLLRIEIVEVYDGVRGAAERAWEGRPAVEVERDGSCPD